jgi:hypothetical protein
MNQSRDEEILLRFHNVKLSYISSTHEWTTPIIPPTSNILLAPADYLNYWTSVINLAFKTRDKTVWETLKEWQIKTFGFYLKSDCSILSGTPLQQFTPPNTTIGYYLMIYTLDASSGFHAFVQRVNKIYRGRYLQPCNYPDIFLAFAIETGNKTLADITTPLVSRILNTGTTYTPFALETLANLVSRGFPIAKIPCSKSEAFLGTLLRHNLSCGPFGNTYDVSFLNIQNIGEFTGSSVLSPCVQLFIAVNFERYKFTIILNMIYWLLLIVVPSLIIPIFIILQISPDILIYFRFLVFCGYFLVFRAYYGYRVSITAPLMFNLGSVYCAVLYVDGSLFEFFFTVYIFFDYFAFGIFVTNKVSFLQIARQNGCFIFKLPNVKYIYVSVSGDVKVSENNIQYYKILKNKIPIHV